MTTEQATAALTYLRQECAVLSQALAEQRRWRDLQAMASLLDSAAQTCRDRARVRSSKTALTYEQLGE